jgi:hypothetical protein
MTRLVLRWRQLADDLRVGRAGDRGFVPRISFENGRFSSFVNSRERCQVRFPIQDTSPGNAATLNRRRARFRGHNNEPNYLASAFSWALAFPTAEWTAARNESVPEGARTLPDNVLPKETFFP